MGSLLCPVGDAVFQLDLPTMGNGLGKVRTQLIHTLGRDDIRKAGVTVAAERFANLGHWSCSRWPCHSRYWSVVTPSSIRSQRRPLR